MADNSNILDQPSGGGGGGAGQLLDVEVYFTSGPATWTKPAGMGFCIVTCVGAGGGGASAQGTGTTSKCGGAGQSGGVITSLFTDAQLAATEAMNIPATAARSTTGNAPGSNGGSCSFGTNGSGRGYVQAAGGLAGAAAPFNDTLGMNQNIPGTNANQVGQVLRNQSPTSPKIGHITPNSQAIGCSGGDCEWGAGGMAVHRSTAGATDANVSTGRGAGGSGGVSHLSTNSAAGQVGQSGAIIIEIYS